MAVESIGRRVEVEFVPVAGGDHGFVGVFAEAGKQIEDGEKAKAHALTVKYRSADGESVWCRGGVNFSSRRPTGRPRKSQVRCHIAAALCPGPWARLSQGMAMTRRRPDPLLCELHAHTRWSDGTLSIRELVDLYGRSGFDVLCLADHLVRVPDGVSRPRGEITAESHGRYLAEIESEAARAWLRYQLLVIPGLELTYEDHDPCRAAHAVAVGLRQPVDLEAGLDDALASARATGAALVAAHPYRYARSATALGRC